ncbi:Transcription factor bye1 [Lithohypha guttulata]|uniref:Transcription factor bye1 n=1 Tax=Lithohypha guttulata TaxID=1690604 RepID=UPI002DE06814|nr:Transcription factor bye1 [Lithohypha guttulata]KAK5103784.1 Transcription factor bye1 [Lithohypha guttulata]
MPEATRSSFTTSVHEDLPPRGFGKSRYTANEPRRSGRATKGVHTKDREDSDGAPKQKGKASKSKKGKAEPEPEDDEQDEEENAYIRCICGKYEEEEEEPRAMICCDKCDAWQHNDCMGLPEDYTPSSYFCEQCKPANHKELLAAIKRGEKPWIDAEIRRNQAKEEKSGKKKGKKGGRKSAARASDANRTPTIEPDEAAVSKKRKAEESPAPPEAMKPKRARSSLRESTNGPNEEEKPPVEDQNEDVMEEDSIFVDVAKDPKEITDSYRSKIATNIVRLFSDQANNLVQQKAIDLAKGETAKGLGTQIALHVEHAVYHVRSGGSGEPSEAYKEQMRSILNNIKTNPDLAKRLMSRQLRPDELAAMDPKDMATEEQKQKDLKEKERMDKQHVLIEEQTQGPRVRKTHKGDEYVEGTDVGREIPETPPRPPSPKPVAAEQKPEMKSPTPADKPSIMRKPSASTKGKPFGDNRRKSSSNFDIDKVYAGVQASPVDAEGPKSQVAGEGSPLLSTAAEADPEVDRLLRDEDNESAPYSPKEFIDEDVVWRGRVDGGSLGTFNTVARFAAGCLPSVDNLRMSWDQVVPSSIKLHGRIQPSKADEYLCGLEYSNTTELIIVNLIEPKDSESREEFSKFFNYLKSKERYGVGSQHQVPAIKDIYFLPMEVGQSLPTVMKALDHTLPDPATERSLLLPIVIKWTELPHNAEKVKQMNQAAQLLASQSPNPGHHVAQTPITPHEPQIMQLDGTSSYSGLPNPTATINGGAASMPRQQSTPTPAQQGAYSTPPPQAQTQTQQPQQQIHHPLQQSEAPAAKNAMKILGPEMAAAPAVVELIATAPGAGELEFEIIKECITENSEAGRRLDVLTHMLQLKYQSQRSSQQSGGGGTPAPTTPAGT